MENKSRKNILVVSLLLCLALFLAGCGEEKNISENSSQSTQNQQGQKEFISVLQVVDGDTFSVWMNDQVEIVRVIGIDSPETGEKYRRKECFGRESTRKAIEILEGKKVSLEVDPTQADRDQYDRLLRHVFLENGVNYGLNMIEEGFAEEMTFEGTEYKYQNEFMVAQEKAKQEKRGLWGVCRND